MTSGTSPATPPATQTTPQPPHTTPLHDNGTLKTDITLLTDLHNHVLREAGLGNLVPLVTRLTTAAYTHPQHPTPTHTATHHQPTHTAAHIVETLDVTTAADLARALTVHFHLTNLADERQRARTLLAGSTDPTATVEGMSTDAIWPDVTTISHDTRDRLPNLRIHPVLTAHPTEARRRAVASALHRIAEQLDRHDDPRRGPAERHIARRRMLEEIDTLQRTSALRSTSPQPCDEVSTVITLFDQTLFRAVPRLYRAVEAALTTSDDLPGRQHVPVPAFIRFGSWIGGDRDGNPFVTATITRQTIARHADHVLRALHAATSRVARTLTMDTTSTPASPQLHESLANDALAMPQHFEEISLSSPEEPHRQKLLAVAARLEATRHGRVELSYRRPDDMLNDLALIQHSLTQAGAHRAANGELQHLIWQVETFGFHLAELEIRQHSSIHTNALIELLGQIPGIDNPQAAAADPTLLDHLATHGWPHQATPTTDPTREVLDTLRIMAWLQERWGEQCCGRYIVSFSQNATHLLAVRALARLAVGTRPLRLDVIPLFETGDDLHHCTEILDSWLHQPSTQQWLNQRHRAMEVMLGYSDSAKDIGPISATLLLHQTQTRLVEWATDNTITLTLFHGRGGSLGRGGGPVHRAILAQPPGSVNDRFKITEQGEVIFARYSDVTIAQHHLERLTTAVLLAGTPHTASHNHNAATRFAHLSNTLEKTARDTYLALVTTPGFADVLAQASPLEELSGLRLGSRPARRSAATSGRDLSDFRAIPWVFAWAQTRANIPGWYGLGTALASIADPDHLRQAYQDWPLFTTLIDIAEMSLAKTNRHLAEGFLALGNRPDITSRIIAEMDLTRTQVLAVLGQTTLLEHKPLLHTAVTLRAPYIDAMSHLQLRALRVLRSSPTGTDADSTQVHSTQVELIRQWGHVLLLTVNGTAAGLQNTG